MRGSFLMSFIYLNFNLLQHNPVTKVTYAVFLVIQILTILIFPYFIFFSASLKETSLMRNIYDLGGQQRYPMIAIVATILSIQILALILYVFNWIQELYNMRLKRRKHYSTDLEETSLQSNRFLLRINMALLVFTVKILTIPSKTCYVRSMMQTSTDGTFNMTLFSLSLTLMFVDTINSLIFHCFLQCSYPIYNKVPWASAERSYQFVLEFVLILFSVICSIHQSQVYSYWIYFSFTPFGVALSLYLKTPYSKFTMILQNAGQASVVSSMIILAIMLRRLNYPREQFTVIIFIYLIITFLFLTMYTQLRKRNILGIKEIITKKGMATKWIWAFQNEFSFDSETKIEKLREIVVNFEIILSNHQLKCSNSECKCKRNKFKKLLKNNKYKINYEFACKVKILLVEIYLNTILTNQEQELDKGPTSTMNGLLIVYEWFVIKKNYLSCVYNLSKYHDCKKCSLYECFQFQTLQKLIQNEIQQRIEVDEGQKKFQKLIYFESNFKHYQKVIETTIHEVSEYWQTVMKNQLDIVKAEKMSNHILQSYQKFGQLYNFMTKECGDIISIESLAWRFHQEILNFDGEAIQNLDKIKQIITKQRFNNKSDNTLSQFNFKSCFIVIGAFKHNFHKILAASKSLSKLTGFSEDVLLSNTMQIILPFNYSEAHEKFIKNYLKRKRGSLKQSLITNQWIKTSLAILKPVNISVMPKYDVVDGLRLIGLIEPIKKIEIFDTMLTTKSVFGIFANQDLKIFHLTESCLLQLNLNPEISLLDISVNQVFTDIPDELVHDQTYICDMDLSQCYSNQFREENEKNKCTPESKFLVKVLHKERIFENGQITREFLFVIIGNSDSQIIRQVITDGRQSTLRPIYEADRSTEQFQIKQNLSSDSKSLDMTSLSSQGSSSSGTSQDTQLNSIKSSIEFTSLPQSLISYRLWLFIGFIAIMIMGFVLLGYNLYTKQRFQNDLDALQNEKRVKNNFLSSNLVMLMTLGSQNMPSYFNYTSIQVKKVNKTTFGSYYQGKLGETTNRLHDFLVSFSLNANSWDQSLVEQMNTQQISVNMLTSEGNLMNTSQTFYKSVTQYLDYVDFLANSQLADFKMEYNIFEKTTLDKYSKIIKSTTGNQKIITQYISFVLFNGGSSYLDKLDEIDDAFLDKIDVNGQSLIIAILTIALCSSGLVVVIFALYIPYCFGVEYLNLKIIKFIYKTDKDVIQEILNHAKSFKEFIEKNRFLLLHNKKKLMRNQNQEHSLNVTDIEEFKENDIHRDQLKNKNADQDFVRNLKKIDNLKDISKQLSTKKIENLKLQKQQVLKQKMVKQEILQEDNDEENEDEEDSHNHKTTTQQYHSTSTTNPTQSGALTLKDHNVNAGSYQIEFQKIQMQNRKRKFLILIFFFIIGSIFVMFFMTIYFLSNDLFSSFNSAFDLFDIFYLRNICFTGPYFLLEKSILLNESLQEGTYESKQFQKIYDQCSGNEQEYRDIKKAQTGIFAGLIDELEEIDSYQLCEFLIRNKASGNECYTEGNGIMSLGLEQIVQYYLTTLNQQKIAYMSKNNSNDAQFREQMFFNKEVIQNIAVFYAQLQWVVRYVQEKSKSIFDQKMNENFIQIIVIYSIFEVLVVVLAMLCIYKLVLYLKRKLLQIRFILKLLPSTEIVKHKSFLEKLNTRLL